MSNAFDPNLWVKLSEDPAASGFIRRRVAPSLAHDVFIGELRPGRERVLILEIMGSNARLPQRRPSSKGLNVDVEASVPNLVKVRLTSTSPGNASLFAELADDIVGVLASDPSDGAAGRVLDRIVAWQAFFASKRDDFSLERAAGLFSELHVLREAFLPVLGAAQSVGSWCGPDPAVQDFQLGRLAVEVKSFRGTGPGQLVISSERQLDLVGVDSLYVVYVRLDQRSDGAGTTLLEEICSLRDAIAGSALAVDLLEQRLLSYGWHDSFDEFRSEKYVVRASELFRVEEDFPRITAAGLPNGVGSVSYRIDRSAIGAFLVPWDEFAGVLKESK